MPEPPRLPEAGARQVNEALGLSPDGVVRLTVVRLPPGGPRDGDYVIRFRTVSGEVVVVVPMAEVEDVDFALWPSVLKRLRATARPQRVRFG